MNKQLQKMKDEVNNRHIQVLSIESEMKKKALDEEKEEKKDIENTSDDGDSVSILSP